MNWTHDKLSFVLHHDLRISIKNRNIMKDYPQHVVNVLFHVLMLLKLKLELLNERASTYLKLNQKNQLRIRCDHVAAFFTREKKSYILKCLPYRHHYSIIMVLQLLKLSHFLTTIETIFLTIMKNYCLKKYFHIVVQSSSRTYRQNKRSLIQCFFKPWIL